MPRRQRDDADAQARQRRGASAAMPRQSITTSRAQKIKKNWTFGLPERLVLIGPARFEAPTDAWRSVLES